MNGKIVCNVKRPDQSKTDLALFISFTYTIIQIENHVIIFLQILYVRMINFGHNIVVISKMLFDRF